MKKTMKIIGWVLLSLIGLLIVATLLLRFCFREEALDYLSNLKKEVWTEHQQQRVALLRNAGAYSAEPDADYRFTYRQDTARAREIRDYFRLDTLLAPGATTWENTLSLARFVARNIPHNNQKVYPEVCNATGLWEYTRTVEPAFNCRLHSILLHELLLASDITNRFVTCLPADSLDQDCHVVNVVWLPERKKWAMIDSDMRAWVAAPDATPLSLEEMRERYIADEPMEVHPLLDTDADFSYYRAYWAKNLYWFICWEDTGYDKEVEYEGRIVVLRPQGFDGFKIDESAVRTSDPARFWAAPQPLAATE